MLVSTASPIVCLTYRRDPYLQTLVEFLLLFVNYSQAKVNLIGFFKIWRHTHDLRECLFRVVKGAVAVIQNPDTVP